MTDSARPLVERLFDADRDVLVAEDALMDIVESTEAAGKWDDWSRDHYDSSLELYGVQPDVRLSEESRKKFEAAGLSIVWLNHSDGWETTYSLHRGTEHRAEKGIRERGDMRHKLNKVRESTAKEIADWLDADAPTHDDGMYGGIATETLRQAAKKIREKYGVTP